ncbi:MAG TPA: hypothetical protein VK995_03650 [Oceanipulchritudo sp.]|nr:hypothetical protein [Oceanipulchritudo sp.]
MACGNGHAPAPTALTGSQLRAMDSAGLARLGEESLRSHLVDTAIAAHQLYSPLDPDRLEAFLEDRNFVRHPVRIQYEIGNMAPHQFANPEQQADRFLLNVHPQLQGRAEDLALAIAYFIPVLNYGALINDDHCLIYGATLHGLTIEEYYRQLCRIAALTGAAPRDRNEPGDRF